MTYGELEVEAERWASWLRAAGAGPGSCVAVLLPRSARFVLAVVAVMKTGAAYLPLDPVTPVDRVGYILGDSGASLVLTDGGGAGGVPVGSWAVVDLDQPLDVSLGVGEAPAVRATDPGGVAYVIYTSGSTGRPKGVEITHANLAFLVDWHVAAFGVTDRDRVSQVAGLGFDAAVWELWPSLAVGASVHVADDRTHRSPRVLQDWLVAQEITIAFAPTLLAEQLMQADWPERTALRTLLTGADRLTRRPLPGQPFTVVNNYGPTECTVVSTSGVVAPEEGEHAGPPSIGRALPGTVAMVLDESLSPVADGEPGELVIAGPHVGRGYRNDAQRTAERFVTVSSEDGATLRGYRTGDRVRGLPDGQLAFLGRFDDQVKVRGYRIEPAEILGWLTQCPGVGAAAVTVLGSGEDDRELAAYVVAAGEVAPPAARVREFLAAQLPEYMVPTHVIAVSALPTTPNGKLDTAALPRPGVAHEAVTASATPEAADGGVSDVVEWVGALVAELLEQPRVGVDDNIFMIGGHSMLAMQTVSRIRQHYGVDLTLRQLFRGPTVSAISAHVAYLREAGA